MVNVAIYTEAGDIGRRDRWHTAPFPPHRCAAECIYLGRIGRWLLYTKPEEIRTAYDNPHMEAAVTGKPLIPLLSELVYLYMSMALRHIHPRRPSRN